MRRNLWFFAGVMLAVSINLLAHAAETPDIVSSLPEPFVLDPQRISLIALIGIIVKWFMSHIDAKDEKFVKAIREKDIAYEQLSMSCRREIAELTAIVLRELDHKRRPGALDHDGG